MAFTTAGAMGGVPGSPTPEGLLVEGMMCTSIAGIWLMRRTRVSAGHFMALAPSEAALLFRQLGLKILLTRLAETRPAINWL
jgi:hypothetical protein